jgi:hypothetical protein
MKYTFGIILYSFAKITWGLLVHPYQTMQSLLRERSFVWMVLLPSVVLFLSKMLWLALIVPSVRFAFSCSTSYFVGCALIPLFANWLTFFCVIWQVMLLYLLIRFSKAFKISY